MSSALSVIPILVITHLYFSIMIYTEKTMFPAVTISEFFDSFGYGGQPHYFGSK